MAVARGVLMTSMETQEFALSEGSWTVVGAFRRDDGPGPLVESLDGSLQVAFDHDGFLASRVAGEVRVTPLDVASLAGRWAAVMLRRSETNVELWIDGEQIDQWNASAGTPPSGIRVMRDVDGGMRELLVFEQAISDADAAKFLPYFKLKEGGKYVQFSRTDVPRVQTG
jgi:hypothetical protein